MEAGKEATVEMLKEAMTEVIEQARKVPEVPQNQHHQIITVHHAEPPKPAPWQAQVCVTACLMMFVGLIVMAVMYLDLRREQQRSQDHLSVIYQLIPDLKKMVDAELCRQGKLKNCKITDI